MSENQNVSDQVAFGILKAIGVVLFGVAVCFFAYMATH